MSEEGSLARGILESVSLCVIIYVSCFSRKLNLAYQSRCFGYLNRTARSELTPENNIVHNISDGSSPVYSTRI